MNFLYIPDNANKENILLSVDGVLGLHISLTLNYFENEQINVWLNVEYYKVQHENRLQKSIYKLLPVDF